MTERTVTTNGVDLHVVDEGEGPLVVLAHGFPELSYSWRHQIPALAEAGYRVLAPDQRGYGRSSRPEAITDYDIAHLTDDLLGLLDDVGAPSATFVGHDWGALVVWQMALLHPDRVDGVVGMSVPYIPRGEMPPVQLMRQLFGEQFFYIIYFQEPGVADADLGRDPATTMRRMLSGLAVSPDDPAAALMSASDGRGFVDRLPEVDTLPDWLSQDELDHYVAEFTRTGFTGGINWYRNFDRNWELLAGARPTVEVPAFFIGGSRDPVLVFTPLSVMQDAIPDLRGTVVVEGAGHWVQQERPDEVNPALIGFLDDIHGRAG